MLLYNILSLLGLIPTFQKSKCKKLLELTIKRVKLLKSRQEVQLRQLRRDVAELLQLGKEQKAQIWIGRIFKELRLMSVYSKIAHYCHYVQVNLPEIAKQRDCPSGLEEPLASLCFAALCCANLPELQEFREIFATKYGRHFVTFPQELRPDSQVDQEFLDFFHAKDPSDTLKQALLKEIASEYDVKQSNQQDIQDTELLSMEENEENVVASEHCAEVDTALQSNEEQAQEIANRKRMYEGKPTRSLSFKRAYRRRQPLVGISAVKEESGDEIVRGKDLQPCCNVVSNDDEGRIVYGTHEDDGEYPILLEGPPRRAPPPPPPRLPERAPPLPPSPLPAPLLRTGSMPTCCEKQAITDMVAPLYHSSSMEHEYTKGSYRTHVHPKLPMYEDLVANFVALKH